MGEGEMQTTRLYLYSEALHISGFADVIEERSGVLLPVEYKHGQQADWLNDHIQLCAQALCLEERQPGKPLIPYGYIYYVGSRRRVQVQLTPELRAKTRATIEQALRLATFEKPPAPLEGKLVARCPNCTMLPLCMPEEVRQLQSKKRK
jgi:CRISPR-associated exonuclease Cas4